MVDLDRAEFMRQFHEAVALVCLIPEGGIDPLSINPRLFDMMSIKREQHIALMGYARSMLTREIRNQIKIGNTPLIESSVLLYREAREMEMTSGLHFLMHKLSKQGILKDKSTTAIDEEYTTRPKKGYLKRLPVSMRQDYLYYRRAYLVFTQAAVEFLTQRADETGSISALKFDGKYAIELGDHALARLRAERYPDLSKK